MIEELKNRSIYVDANIVVYFVEKPSEWRIATLGLFEALTHGNCMISTSALSIGECMYRPFRDNNAPLIALYDELFRVGDIRVIPIENTIVRSAAALAAHTKLKLNDGIHVATAIASRCDVFVTNDARIRSVPDLRVIQLVEFDK